MLLAVATVVIVVAALLAEVLLPRLDEALERRKARRARVAPVGFDPGRELRAEQRARQLLKSCVNDEEWGMFRDLGFIRVWGRQADGPGGHETMGASYAYLVYPHKPILAFLPQTGRLLSEYCVEFPDETRPYGSPRLPDSDDVLAKWMALTGDERRVVTAANMHLPGRQHDPKTISRDLWRLRQWELEWSRRDIRPSREPSR